MPIRIAPITLWPRCQPGVSGKKKPRTQSNQIIQKRISNTIILYFQFTLNLISSKRKGQSPSKESAPAKNDMSHHTEYAPIIPCQPPTHKRFRNLKGLKFGRLFVREFAGKRININGATYCVWNCSCDCGGQSYVPASALTNGNTRSCGCLKVELDFKRSITHGLCRSPEYGVWMNMNQRCKNQLNVAWKNYGGRGITVCERWNNFALFYADMGPRPTPKHTLERLDNDAGYGPENCSWETRTVQNNNSRNNRLLTIDGKTMNVSEWARHAGLRVGLIRARLNYGWSDERAVKEPKGKYR